MAVSFNLDGQALTFPDWASEATAEQILDILKGIAKSSGASEKDQKKITDSARKTLDELKKGNANDDVTADEQKKRDEKLFKETKEFGKSTKELGRSLEQYKLDKKFDATFLGTLKASFEAEGENVGRAIFQTGEHLYKGAAYVGGAVQQYGAMLGNSILGAGASLNDLAKVGVGFNDTYSGMATTAGLGVAQLAGLTGSFGEAAAMIRNSSSVVATQGFGNFTKSMRFASDISEELGMSLEDSMNTFSEALNSRQGLMNLGNLDQGRMNKQIQKSTKMQMAYATAIGVSTEEMQSFVSSLTRDNGLLSASLLRFDDTLRGDVIAGIEVFASGLAGMGGKAGQEIASAFLEAGTAGAIGMSDAATGFVTALPSLAGPMNEFANAMKDGTLTQEQSKDMVNNLTGQLGNLSKGEKDRIYAMARIGNESAKTMANAIAQFEQSESKLKEVNDKFGTAFNMDTVQKGTNQFNKMMTNISGGASNAFYSLFADPEIMKVIEEGMSDIFELFGMGVDDLAGSAMDAGGMVKSMVPAVKSFVGFIVDIGKSVAGFFAQFKSEEGFDFGGMIDGLIGKATGLLFKGLVTFVGVWLGLTWATHYAKTILGPRILTFAKGMFAKHKGPAMAMAKNALEYTKTMFAKKGGPAIAVAKNALQYTKNMFSGKGVSGSMTKNALDYSKQLFGSAGKSSKNVLNNAINYAKLTYSGSKAKGVASKIGEYASKYGSMLFSGGKKVAQKIAGFAAGMMGKLTKGGAPDVVGKGVAKAGGLVSSLGAKAKSLVPKGLSDKVSGMGGKVSGMLKGASDNADKAAMPMGKGGGFLQTIADAVKKFGDNKVLKGAAAIALLGASVGIAGVGLKQFNDVDFSSLVKGTLALGGLAALAQVLGKGSVGMMMGAAAILLLGASVVPLAFGLNLMKDVGLGTIGVLAAGLVTLGAAAAILSFASPFIIAGSFAIAALGVALGIFGVGMSMVTGPLDQFVTGMANLAEVDGGGLTSAAGGVLAVGAAMALMAPLLPFMLIGALVAPAIEKMALATMMFNFTDMKNLALAGPALKSLGEGMSAMSGGSLMSSIKDGIGSLFGADSPVDKLKVFIGELSNLDITPLLSTAFAFDLLLTSSDRLQEFGTNLAVISMYTEPFVEQMNDLSLSLLLMGNDPFAPFNTLTTHSESMSMFATSTEQLTAALDNIEFDYIATGFTDIADSIEDMAAAMSEISMGDMLKMGAMRLIGPSKEEIQEDDKQTAVKSHARDKLQGDFGGLGIGLQGLMDKISMSSGKMSYGSGESAHEQMLTRLPELGAAGIDLDVKKMQSNELGVAATEMQRVTGLLQSQIDMYKMQERTGVIAEDVPTTAQAVAEVMDPITKTPAPAKTETDKDAMAGGPGAGMTETELLQELVRLTTANNRLLKTGNRLTGELEV